MTGIVRTKARIKYATHTVSVDSFWALSWIVGACARAIVLSAIAIGMASISSTNFILNNVPTKKRKSSFIFLEHFEHCLLMKQQTKEQMNHTNEAIFSLCWKWMQSFRWALNCQRFTKSTSWHDVRLFCIASDCFEIAVGCAVFIVFASHSCCFYF